MQLVRIFKLFKEDLSSEKSVFQVQEPYALAGTFPRKRSENAGKSRLSFDVVISPSISGLCHVKSSTENVVVFSSFALFLPTCVFVLAHRRATFVTLFSLFFCMCVCSTGYASVYIHTYTYVCDLTCFGYEAVFGIFL